MVPSIDDKALAQDTTQFGQAFVREGKHPALWIVPLTAELMAKDICIYGPVIPNKIGKEGKRSMG